jgi:ribosome-associated translation inhibitor RaiA
MDLELIKKNVTGVIMREITYIAESKHWKHADIEIHRVTGKIDDSILEIHGEEIRKAAQSAIDEAFVELKRCITKDIMGSLYLYDSDENIR